MGVILDTINAEIALLEPYPAAPRYLEGYGEDISALTDVKDWRRTFEGELLKQQAFRRITTARGSYFGDPEYGIDIQEFLHSRLTLVDMSTRIVAEIKKDDRIDRVECTAERRDQVQIIFHIAIVPVNLPFAGFAIRLDPIIDPTGITNV